MFDYLKHEKRIRALEKQQHRIEEKLNREQRSGNGQKKELPLVKSVPTMWDNLTP